MSIILKTVALTKSYQMGEVTVNALNGVDLEIEQGEFIVLLGQSGSGKSTLLNLIGGLDTTTSGKIFFENTRIDQWKTSLLTEYRRNNIGFIFQMYNLLPRLTARENVQLVTEIARAPLDPIEALRLVGLEQRADHFPSQLSGGEQQRVAIARAIAKQPRLLFCDEPTGALDVTTGVLVLEAIQKVNREIGTTTIVISHNKTIAKMANRVILLKDGQIEDIHKNTVVQSPRDLEW